MMKSETLILRGAHVIDPSQRINNVADVVVKDGCVEFVGDATGRPADTAIDLSGHYLSPGWIDIHVHAYGTLGFADPDSIGVRQGVTTFVDAGGAGIGVMDEFEATMAGLETSIYAGPFVRPLGLIGLGFTEGEVRSLGTIPITQWVDFMLERGDMVRYLKCNAMGNYGPGSLKLSKGLAQILGVPLYMHIGEFQRHTPDKVLAMEAFRIAEPGDMITHMYHGNLGKVTDDTGKVLDIVRAAQDRGVIMDVGFGGFNFSWRVADQAFNDGLIPNTISSDLQQFNVVGPVKSLANVMSAIMSMGMSLEDAIVRVTSNAAKAISLQEHAGSLRVGMPADITVFDVARETAPIFDCHMQKREVREHVTPLMTFKNGRRIDCDLTEAQAESNWLLQIAEDAVPGRALALDTTQKVFLIDLARALKGEKWRLSSDVAFDYGKALELQAIFHAVRVRHPLSLRNALDAVYSCFVERRFTLQIGLLIMCVEQPLFFARIAEVTDSRMEVSA